MDPRATRLASVLIDHSLKVASGDKVVLAASDLTALEILQECYRLCLERGAFVELDIMGLQLSRGRCDAGKFVRLFLEHANDEQLIRVSEISKAKITWGNKFLFVVSVHDDLFLSGIDNTRLGKWQAANFVLLEGLLNQQWVLTQFPTAAMAKNAGMTLEQCIDFYYDACLIDYPEEAKRLQRLQDVLDAGKRVRVIGPRTDLTLGIDGRLAAGTNLGNRNVPDGECFVGPQEDVTEGEIFYELPQVRDGNIVSGIHLKFEKGGITDFSAEEGEDFLRTVLNAHPGNRRFGELGIGMNRAVTQYMKATLFDEKIAGTVHMALGRSYNEERGGGKNTGSIHWDLVKDLRFPGTLVTVDDRPIIKDGNLLV